MKALVKSRPEEGLWLEEVPIPECGDQEVLIKVRKSSICGTDVHIYNWDDWARKTIPVPLVVGHEFMGEVVDKGSLVKTVNLGDRVSAEGHIFCNACVSCKKGTKYHCLKRRGIGVHRPGSFAEYISLPEENVFKLPLSVSDEEAAIFDPFGNAMHTAMMFPLTSEDVLITGAGPIGIMATAIAKKSGARRIFVTDINQERLELAQKMGATSIVNVSKTSLKQALKEQDLTTGFTVGMEMSGSPIAFQDMLENMRHGGKIALLGIFPPNTIIDWDLVIFKLLTLQGIYGRHGFNTWFQMINMLESGLDITPVITHHFNIQDFEKGFELMRSGKSGKIILNW
jgi:threonine 3-dehydrogenase